MYLILLQIASPDMVQDRFFNINPSNVLGTLVGLMFIIIIYLIKQNNKLEREIRILQKRMLDNEKTSITIEELRIFQEMKTLFIRNNEPV